MADFPPAPSDSYSLAGGGQAFEKVDTSLMGHLLSQASNTAASGSNCIPAGIVKVFWHWDQTRFIQLVRACIWLGHHPDL